MIDPEGEEWLTLTEAVGLTGIPLGTLSVWVARAKVRSHRIDRRRWVCIGDIWLASASRRPTGREAQS